MHSIRYKFRWAALAGDGNEEELLGGDGRAAQFEHCDAELRGGARPTEAEPSRTFCGTQKRRADPHAGPPPSGTGCSCTTGSERFEADALKPRVRRASQNARTRHKHAEWGGGERSMAMRPRGLLARIARGGRCPASAPEWTGAQQTDPQESESLKMRCEPHRELIDRVRVVRCLV